MVLLNAQAMDAFRLFRGKGEPCKPAKLSGLAPRARRRSPTRQSLSRMNGVASGASVRRSMEAMEFKSGVQPSDVKAARSRGSCGCISIAFPTGAESAQCKPPP